MVEDSRPVVDGGPLAEVDAEIAKLQARLQKPTSSTVEIVIWNDLRSLFQRRNKMIGGFGS